MCGWDNSQCPDGSIQVIICLNGTFITETMPVWAWPIIALVIIVCIMAIISFFVLRHYRQEAELAAMTWRIRWDELTGEERRKERQVYLKFSYKSKHIIHSQKKNLRGGTAWLLDDVQNGDQMNPLIERTNSQNSLSHKVRSRLFQDFVGHLLCAHSITNGFT